MPRLAYPADSGGILQDGCALRIQQGIPNPQQIGRARLCYGIDLRKVVIIRKVHRIVGILQGCQRAGAFGLQYIQQ
ncbi:hypothetical protein OB446_005985, partial [Paenibacillus alvei]|uniref:hypothetical protein n=1 Tax=Paenibacillus alvei TaxID=44250 RepID=UPI0021D33D21